MRVARLVGCFVLFLICVSLPLVANSKKLTVMGRLTQVTTIGAETSGWAIELNPVLMFDGKQISSLELKSSDTRKLESLEDRPVRATGILIYESGVETGRRPIFELSSIKPLKQK